MTQEKYKRINDFFQKWAVLKEQYLWRGTKGEDPRHLEKSSLRYIRELGELVEEYKDLIEDEV